MAAYQEAIQVKSVQEESNHLSRVRCECGGRLIKTYQRLVLVEKNNSHEPVDEIVMKCVRCKKESTFLFDVSDSFNGGESEKEENRGGYYERLTRKHDTGMLQLKKDKEKRFRNFTAPAPRMTEDEKFEDSPFCVPYRQLLQIYTMYEENKLSSENAVALIEEGKEYLKMMMKHFEPNELIVKINPSIAEANRTIWQGLSLMLKGYNKLTRIIQYRNLGDSLRATPFYRKFSNCSFLAEESRWDELIKAGNTLVTRGKQMMLNLQA